MSPRYAPRIEFLDCTPEPVSAIRNGHAGFRHIALAYHYGRADVAETSATDREALRSSFPKLLETFEQTHGKISRSYFATSVLAAAVLTEEGELSIAIGYDLPPKSCDLVALLLRGQQVAYAAYHRLAESDRNLCQHMVIAVVEEVLRRLDRQVANGSGPPDCDDLANLKSQLDAAEDFMLRSATRRAQIRYLHGLLFGTAAVAGVLVGTAALVAVLGVLTPLAGDLLAVATAGAVGAFVSVLARMTSGTFRMNLPTLSSEMGRKDLHLMGGLRPLVGLAFALAAYVLVVSALVPMETASPSPDTFLFAGIGFLAGFSERFAQDMFVRSGQGVSGVMADSPSSGPSAGLAPTPGAQPAK
jgi:hypothetical protein